MTAPCAQQRHVEWHFEGRLSPDEEHAFRDHLASCATCRTQYDARLALNRLTHSGPTPQERLARGLGLDFRDPAPASSFAWPKTLSLAVAGLAVSFAAAIAWNALRATGDDGFAPRGNGASASLEVYRLGPEGSGPERNPTRLSSRDEIAFAYRNPGNAKWLMVYAVDGAEAVAWYYPEWATGQPPPSAVPAEPGGVLHELPSAISLPLHPGRATLHLVLLEQALTTAQVEQFLRARQPVARGKNDSDITVTLEVLK